MKNRSKFLTLLLTLAILLAMAALAGSVQADNKGSVYVPETGHWIWGEFLTEYNSVDDPLLYFGYPITDDFIDSVTGQHVQYFQKARFDLVDTDQGTKVQIAPLGKLLHEDDAQLADIASDGPTCRKFPSGYSVCYAFLQFYDAYKGETYFGNPVSALEVIDGRYVQYFENSRMEWWPERSCSNPARRPTSPGSCLTPLCAFFRNARSSAPQRRKLSLWWCKTSIYVPCPKPR